MNLARQKYVCLTTGASPGWKSAQSREVASLRFPALRSMQLQHSISSLERVVSVLMFVNQLPEQCHPISG
eukprot:362452-Chlamydomonas_euryale.AAC.6